MTAHDTPNAGPLDAAQMVAQINEMIRLRPSRSPAISQMANWRDTIAALQQQLDEARAERDEWKASSKMFEATAAEAARGLECLSEIDDAWDAFGSAGNRKVLTLAEQIASRERELEAAELALSARDAPTDEKTKWQTWARKMLDIQSRFWVRAAKAALAGDMRELRNRVELAEAEPVDVVLSSEGDAPQAQAVDGWRYEIQHGPEGETDYAWVYRGKEMICTTKTHHAIAIVSALTRPSTTEAKPVEALLREFAEQRHPLEMAPDERDGADWEGACAAFIEKSRAILSKEQRT